MLGSQGEDPYMSGEYSVAFVHGMERAPEDPAHIQASACCKHFAANSMEHATEGGQTHTRHNFDANITVQDLVDSYLAPFQSCVEKGQVSGLMCSYNSVSSIEMPMVCAFYFPCVEQLCCLCRCRGTFLVHVL